MLRNKLYLTGHERAELPVHLHFGKEMFDRMVQYNDGIALINSDTGEKVTYAELARQTASVALSLTRMGIRKGDVVSICSEKRFEVMPTLLGIICAGATYSPFDPSYGSAQITHRLGIAKSKMVFCSLPAYEAHRQTLEASGTVRNCILYGQEAREGATLFSDFLTESCSLEEFLPTPVNGWEDRAFIMYSSGTTGLPKGIPLTHLNYLLDTGLLVGGYCESYVNKRILNTREWYYSYVCIIPMYCLRGGATIVFSQRNQPADWLSAVLNYKVQLLQLTPSTIMDMIKTQDLDKYDLSSVEYIMSASTTLMADQVKLIKEKIPGLVDIISMYGMSEAGCVCSNWGNKRKLKPGSSGLPHPGFVCKVVDMQTREPLGPNQRGEICFQSPSLIKEYIGSDIAKDMDKEGFFKTGDLGYYDEDHNIFIVDRIKELIKFKDIAVAPEELEVIIVQHEAVREVGVVGVPHAEYVQAPLAFVVLQPNAAATEEELVNFLHDRVTYRMRLAGGVRFVEKLPRGAGAKLDRKALKQMI